MQRVHSLPLFIDATDDELDWLIRNSREVMLDAGDFFFEEGQLVREFYVVLDGELQVSRTVDGEEIILGTTPRGVMGGETFLLSGSVAASSARAIMPSRLMVFDQTQFLGIFSHCPSVGLRILATAAERMQGFAKLETQREKMAALGKLSAGLAHELNNPAAAARRSANMLQQLLPGYEFRTLRLGSLGLSPQSMDSLIAFLSDVRTRKSNRAALSAIDKADREDELCDWLDDQGVDDFWELGAGLADWHVTVDELDTARAWVPEEHADELFTWLVDTLTAADLLDEIEECTVRISDLIGAVKSYTYMDRGTYQEVDIHKDLDNTLLILRHRLQDVTVDRRYEPDLPHLIARGSALNQVWTNLIDNAVDAIDGRGTLTLITRCENDFIMVEVADDGPGIAPDVQPRLFEPFYTTKEVGSGMGLGLDISYRIIRDHRGTIEVRSEPGNTRFIVRLPLHPGDDESSDPKPPSDAVKESQS